MNVKQTGNENEAVAATVLETKKVTNLKLKWLIALLMLFTAILIFNLATSDTHSISKYFTSINPHFYYFLIAGFVFAMIDGAIGMSYGVTSTTFALSMGIPPTSASTAVHLSEVLSNGIAGFMHKRMGNVNKSLLRMLLVPGIIGAVSGAYILSSLQDYAVYTKPIVSLYTFILGILILSKALQSARQKKGGAKQKKIKKIGFLGFIGGFVDAVGGGGWGSIVLSSLIAGGRHPRFSLGTVKYTRFFIALLSSLTFVTLLDNIHWEAVAGLVLGSAIASPIAAKVSNRISAKSIMITVGIIVILVSLKSIFKFVFTIL